MKNYKYLILTVLFIAAVLSSCGDSNEPPVGGDPLSRDTVAADMLMDVIITFEGDSISSSHASPFIKADGSSLTLTKGGEYTLTGDLNDGEVIVEAPKNEEVKLILGGVNITNKDGAAIYVKSCDKVIISLEEHSVNTLCDGETYNLTGGETKPNACLYSSEDIDIEGNNGRLHITGNYNNGIGSKNDIDIEGGQITISAVNNALKGNDSVSIIDGSVKITAADDGIKADSEDDPEKGFVSISGGYVEIICSDDAISAYNKVSIMGGTVMTRAGGKTVNCDGSIALAEGVLTEMGE